MTTRSKASAAQLTKLYQAAINFKQAKPWTWLSEVDLIAVENSRDKTIGYCSITGQSGLHFSLSVYLSEKGLAGLNYLFEHGRSISSEQSLFYQDCLMASFEDRSQLSPKDWQETKDLGFNFRGKKAWPQFRRFEPGYFPWYLTDDEAFFLTEALEQSLIVVELIKKGELALEFDRSQTVLRFSEEKEGELIWNSTKFPLLPWVADPPMVEITDELFLQRLKKSERRRNILLQSETCYLPMSVQDEKEQRPFFPRAFILIEAHSGVIVEHSMYEDPAEDVNEVLNGLSHFCLEHGLPGEIQVKSREMVAILEDFCQKTGIRLTVVENLPIIEAFIAQVGEEL